MLKKILLTVFLFALSFLCRAYSANSLQDKLASHPHVDSIKIIGLSRTEENVVRRELLFKEGDGLTTGVLLRSIQALKNLQIFSFVRPYLELEPGNKVKLTLELSEKWTTIPFASFSQGGGTNYYYFGVYDINLFGKYIEAGLQYDNWNGEDGGIVWFRDPRFLDRRILLGADIWATQKPISLYNRKSDDQGEFVLQQKQLNLSIKKEIKSNLQLGLMFELSKDRLHNIQTTSAIDATTNKLLNNHQKSTTLLNTFIVELGKLNYDIDVVSGKKITFQLSHSNAALLSSDSFNKVKWVGQTYWQLPRRSYFATNLTLAATDTPLLQEYYYVGGFEHIRGYLDGQFRNRNYWQLNTEYRIPSYRSQWIILQHVLFIDVINSTHRVQDLTNFDNNVYSAGTGIRLISPKIYSFNGRFDFAFLTSEKTEISLSFGTQHFF